MNRYCSILSRSFASFLALALVNLSVPMGGITHLAPDPNAPKPAPAPAPEKPFASRPLSAKVMRSMQGKAGKNPYAAGSGKWDIVYKGVNLFTGNFSTSGNDLSFEGGYGIPVNVTRTYNSNDTDEGPLGEGWTLSVDVRNTAGGLLKGPSSPVRSVPLNFKERPSAQNDPKIPDANEPVEAVIATDAGGQEETIQKDADGILTTPAWDKNRNVSEYENVVDGGNIYQILVSNTVTTPEGTVYVYQKKGSYPYGTVPWNDSGATATPCNVLKPVSVTDRHGNVTTYNYGSTDVTFSKANGSVTEKRLESIEMPNGHEIAFTWGNGTNAPTNRIRTASDGVRTVTYGYTSGLLTSVTTPAGLVTAYEYATSATPPSWSDDVATHLMSKITDPRGLETTMYYVMGSPYILPYNFAFDIAPYCYKVVHPNGSKTLFQTDAIDNPDYTGPFVGYPSFEDRDSSNNTLQVAEAVVTTPGVGPLKVRLQRTSPSGPGSTPQYCWERSYDPFSQNMVLEESFIYSRAGGSKTDRYLHDSWMNLQKVSNETVYNFMGNPLKKTTTESNTNTSNVTTTVSIEVTYAYWGREKYYQQKAVKDQAGRYSYTDYFDSSATQGKKGQAYRLYDDKRTSWTTDGGITIPTGTPSADEWKYNLIPSNTSTYSTEYDYDSKGRTIDIWKLQSTTTSPWTYVRTHLAYGADSSPTWGAATSVVEDYGSGKINRTTNTLGYDSIGRATQVQDASGKEFETTYDLDGNVESVYRTDTTPDQLIASYTYGTSGVEKGMVTQIEDGLSGVTQSIAYTSSGGGKGMVASVTETNDSEDYTTSYTYNVVGDREKATYATDNGTTEWKYTDYLSIGEPTSGARVFQTLNKLNSGSPTSEEFHYQYDSAGRLHNAAFAQSPQSGQSTYSASYPAATRARAYYTYDPAGRTTNVEHYWEQWGGSSYGTPTPILGNHCDYELTVAKRGLKTASEYYENNSGSWSLDRTEYYTYDPDLDFLTGADYNDGQANETPSWSYDAAGNRNDSTVVDNLNRATTIGGVSRTYDILGNTLTIGSTKTISWDALSRMTQFAISGGATWTYQYRADGMRVKKSDGTTDSFFYYDDQMPVETLEDDGSTTTVTRNGLGARGIDRIERVNASGTVTGYPIYDAHGNMVATLAKSGSSYTINDQRSYDAWGMIRQGNTTGDPKGRHSANLGHVADDESSFLYMRARYFDVASARFMNQDPSRVGQNFFSYANNNPVRYVDDSGNSWEDDLRSGWATIKKKYGEFKLAKQDPNLKVLAAGAAAVGLLNAWASRLDSASIALSLAGLNGTWMIAAAPWLPGLLISLGSVARLAAGGLKIASALVGLSTMISFLATCAE